MPALIGSVALVTGGASGRTAAKLLAAEGAKVVVARRTQATLPRDMTAQIEAGRRAGAPPGAA